METESEVQPEPVVEAVGLAKRFGSFIALHPLDVTVHPGEFFGVFGPNGAGKSVTFKILLGIIRADKGEISISGVPINYELSNRRDGDLPVFWANSSAAIKKLNWEPELNIDQMCRDTWNWQKNNPNGYTKTN